MNTEHLSIDSVYLGMTLEEVESLVSPPEKKSPGLRRSSSKWYWRVAFEDNGPSMVEFHDGRVVTVKGFSLSDGTIGINDSVTEEKLKTLLPSIQRDRTGTHHILGDKFVLRVILADSENMRTEFALYR